MTVLAERPGLAVVPSQFDVDVALRGGVRVARALACENSGPDLGELVIEGRCLLAGYYEMPGAR
jgi:hypothetical protein